MKKHPTLPNGFGSIKKLSGNRRNPYAVHPPARERNEKGNYIQPTPLCYVPDWYTGFAVLSAYHAGNYKKGMEYDIHRSVERSSVDLDEFCEGVLTNFSLFTGARPKEKTFKELKDFKGPVVVLSTHADTAEVVKASGCKDLTVAASASEASAKLKEAIAKLKGSK